MVLQDSLDFFNIPEDEQDSYVLVDTKSSKSACPMFPLGNFSKGLHVRE